MSELDDRLLREARRSEQQAWARLAKANEDFDANVADVVWPREQQSQVWFWTKKVAWYFFIVLLGYACIWGIMAL